MVRNGTKYQLLYWRWRMRWMNIISSYILPGKRPNWLLSFQKYYHNTKQTLRIFVTNTGAFSAWSAVTTGTVSILPLIIIIIIIITITTTINRTIKVLTNTVSLSIIIIYTSITLFMLSFTWCDLSLLSLLHTFSFMVYYRYIFSDVLCCLLNLPSAAVSPHQ